MAEYIEREALLNSIYENPESQHNLRVAQLLEAIMYHPAADVAPVVHGRWVWDENAMDWGLGGWVCSECQEKNDNIPAKPDIHPSGWVGSYYCPNCGAKMDLEV